MTRKPVPSTAVQAASGKTIYPPEFAPIVAGRTKRKLGEQFGLQNFGVNLTTLAPGAASALMHHHSKQDEFVYVIEGELTVRLGDDEYPLRPGDCVGFKAGDGIGHQIVNRSGDSASYLEIGDRSIGDAAVFPEDDLQAKQDEGGKWLLTHKNGEPY